ncbi:alanine--glyoxylate aminotransferase family protein [Haloplanus rubicundus]|uniref:Alanine--glyoxylate aminotransferase family protein n=1 Tax=Haloplanus rubicundus TaxID=1547898 RepID=A0A345DYK8_9EURY|nr:alanine--glyoxylate aminotransferase family protein [Haloplanus rubicundus]AXG05030.1 alanine--glyoxylate aminotransferase family protein [Haloplanus rubicundus]AXG11501.1 alanine--glyoxylate aminotransferase family protein [Haloplanus rubicundus]
MLLTPGPTALPPSVRDVMSEELINPDVDPAFADRYDALLDKLGTVFGTDDEVVVMGGEGILGLEAAIASTVEPGDRVLCLSNGPYGDGFTDFVESYGAESTLVDADYDDSLPVVELERTLAAGEYDVATMVHCETPTGTLNDLSPALDLLDEHGVLTIVDAVSSLGGAPVPTDRIDICLGASQKCFSAPPGLAIASVSDVAWDRIEARDPASLYTNLLPWHEAEQPYPYTHLTTLVVALDEALDLLLDEGLDAVHDRHREVAAYCRERGAEMGLDPYPDPERSSPTVTAFSVPGRATALQERLREAHDVTLATGFGDLADDVLRVGHMGYNADPDRVERAMDALAAER